MCVCWMMMMVSTRYQKEKRLSTNKEAKMCKHLFRHYVYFFSITRFHIHTLLHCYTESTMYANIIIIFGIMLHCSIDTVYVCALRILHVLSLALIRIHYYNMPILHVRCVCSQFVTHIYNTYNATYVLCVCVKKHFVQPPKIIGCRAR